MPWPGARRAWTLTASALLTLLVVGGAVSVWWASRYAWKVHGLTRGVGDTVFLGADGAPWFRLDDQRHDVALDAIAPDLQHAIVAIEDRRFYLHPGIDPVGISRAVFRGVTEGGRLEGGSTLTQQLARTLYLSNARTLGRKAKEAVLAVMLERELTKAQILELYLNRIYLGAGVYGVESMSEHLFRKDAKDLTLPVSVLDHLDAVTAPAPGDPEWTPHNAEGDTPETLTLRQALLESNNAAAVDLQHRVGTPIVLRLASNAGLRDMPDVPSLALGTGSVSPLELASAYTMFPAAACGPNRGR